MAEVKLKWVNRAKCDEIRVYRSSQPFDVTSLPAPLAVVNKNKTEFTDTNAPNDDTVFYAIGCVTFNPTQSVVLANVFATDTPPAFAQVGLIELSGDQAPGNLFLSGDATDGTSRLLTFFYIKEQNYG